MTTDNPHDHRYAGAEYYWGEGRSALCDRVNIIAQPRGFRKLTLIDLGSGEGRDALYFARSGFEVTALDTSPVGLDKTREKAGEMGVEVNTVNASIIDYDLRWHYDVIFSSGALHYIPETVRPARFRHFREHTAPDGLHAFTVIVRDPNLGVAPDAEPNAYLFEPGELLAYYDDWAVLFYKDEIINCHSGGIPHQHAISRIIARRQ